MVTPSSKERNEVEKVTGEILFVATKICTDAKPLVCGSIAKDTWLAGKGEIDLFLLFDEADAKVLESKGLVYGKKIVKSLGGKFRIAYAEHPYVRAVIRGRKVDIVPAFRMPEGELRSNVDRTPHHVRFVLANLGGLNLDIRSLKRFCECLGVYGSDLKTEGLSGYLCELLVIKYGGFANLAKASRSWKAGEFIDIKQYHKEKPTKFSEPLVVIDPVDRERNVASVLSETNFFILRKALREFSEKPSETFFRFPKSRGKIRKELAERGTFPLLVSFKTPDVIEDILYPQLRKAAGRISKELERSGFSVVRSDVFSSEKSFIFIELESGSISSVDKKKGPSIYSEKNCESFLKAHRGKKCYAEGGFLFSEVMRETTDAKAFLKKFLSGDLAKLGIPSHIAKQRLSIETNAYSKLPETFLTQYAKKSIA